MSDLDAIFALMDAADEALDKDVYEQKRQPGFDDIDTAGLWITAGTDRKIVKVFEALTALRRTEARAVDVAEPIADALIDYVRAPYSRSFVIEKIRAAIAKAEALRQSVRQP